MEIINTENSQSEAKAIIFISILQALLKGFSVFYFLLLPILYATNIIGAEQLGYVGALLIAGILIGALAITYRLHTKSKSHTLFVSLAMLLGATILLFWPHNTWLLSTAYILIGLATGLGISTINALSAQFTKKGKRYTALAKISMLGDVVRIIYPLVAGAIYAAVGFVGLVYFALLTVFIFAAFMYVFQRTYKIDEEGKTSSGNESVPEAPIRKNKSFWFVIGLEFLDSFASSQLFVFLPVLLVFKNFSIENALIMQSAVFVGYLSGRYLVGMLANRFNGFVAVGLAELGMIATIILLLVIPPTNILYVVCFFLGLFSRGTSPVIKALAFDRLESGQMRRGSAIHVIGGDSGSAIAQFVFGLLLAWLGVVAPFIASAICAAIVAFACFSYRESKLEGSIK